jgi:RNA-splicing ligase RtcB
MNLKIVAAGPGSPAHLEDPKRLAEMDAPAGNGALNGHAHDYEDGDHHHGAPNVPHAPRVFESHDYRASQETLALLAEGIKDADLAAPPVVLPDFYHKQLLEMPSSIAVATRNSIRPTLTSAAVNCGMALITFDAPRPSVEQITGFYANVRKTFPFPPSLRRDITYSDVVDFAVNGAESAVERWNLDPGDLLAIEEGGKLDLEPFGGRSRLEEEIPWLLLQLSRMRFGTIGPSTHFVELQEVEEVLEPEIASRLGVHQGQIALQFHAGGGTLTGAIGALYGPRRAGNSLLKVIMRAQKPLHHLATARSFSELRNRFALYFGNDCPPVPRDSAEGERLMVSNAASMNYGFAFRLRTYSVLRALAAQYFGAKSSLVVDSPHNSIYEEEVDGEVALVHRHNTSRAYPASKMASHPVFSQTGQPVLVPGLNKTCSYLCVGSEGSKEALYSACHGTGSIIDDFAARGLSGLDPQGHTTLRFTYDQPEPRLVQHLDNRGVDEGIAILSQYDLVKPVARLRPFAVLN